MVGFSFLNQNGFLTHDDSVRLVSRQYLLGQAVGAVPFFLGK
jgi:hypothetical protein